MIKVGDKIDVNLVFKTDDEARRFKTGIYLSTVVHYYSMHYFHYTDYSKSKRGKGIGIKNWWTRTPNNNSVPVIAKVVDYQWEFKHICVAQLEITKIGNSGDTFHEFEKEANELNKETYYA